MRANDRFVTIWVSTAHMSGETLGQRVRRLREAKKLTQGELGRLSGYPSNMQIYKLEAGITKQAPEPAHLTKMARALGVSMEELLGSSGEPASKEEAAGRGSSITGGPASLRRFLAEHGEFLEDNEREWLVSQRYAEDPDPDDTGWWADQLLRYRKQMRRLAPPDEDQSTRERKIKGLPLPGLAAAKAKSKNRR